MIIGFSSGCLYKTYPRTSKGTIDIFKNLGCNAIELNCLEIENLKAVFENIGKSDLEGFEYVSIHAPKFRELDEEKTKEAVILTQKLFEKINFDCFVIHPDEIKDWNIFLGVSFPISIENMDNRKSIGRTVEDMKEIFKLCDAPMTLDLNHCYSNDPTMKTAYDMAAIFKDRIKEVHLSGYDGYHAPLFITKQNEILKAMPDIDVPIIIESVCKDTEDLKNELEYIKRYLGDKSP